MEMDISSTLTKWLFSISIFLFGTITVFGTPCLPTPGAFTTYSSPVCQGATGVVYTVPTVLGATSYTWAYTGAGATFSSTTNSVTINFSSSATSGQLSVVANGGCGSSAADTLHITLNAIPTVTVTGSDCISSVFTVSSTPNAGKIVWENTSGTLLTETAGWNPNGNTVASSGLTLPNGLFVDASNNIYVSNNGANTVLEYSPSSATAYTTVATVTNNAFGVWVDRLGDVYAVSVGTTSTNGYVEEFFPPTYATGTVVAGTPAGGGTTGSATTINQPDGITGDASGNIYVADNTNFRIQEFTPGSVAGSAGITVAGTGVYVASPGTSTSLSYPNDMSIDASGNMYVSDNSNFRIQKFAPGSSAGTTVAGTGVIGTTASTLRYPRGIYVDLLGNIFVDDHDNDRIQLYLPGVPGTGTTIAGNTTGAPLTGSGATGLNLPSGVCGDINGNIYVADYGNNRVQEFVSTITPTYTPLSAGSYSVNVTAFNGCSNIQRFTVAGTPTVSAVTTGTTTVCVGNTTTFSDATGGGTWTSGNTSIATVSTAGLVGGTGTGTVAITYSVTTSCGGAAASAIITVNGPPATGVIMGATAVCPGGTGTVIGTPSGGTWSLSNGNITIGTGGNIVGVTSGIDRISYTQVNSCGSSVATYTLIVNALPDVAVSGSGCTASALTVTATPNPYSIVWGNTSGTVLNQVAGWQANGITVAGTSGSTGAGAAQLNGPSGVYVDTSGNVFVADRLNHRIQEWPYGASTGITVAGTTGVAGVAANELHNPTDVYLDVNGNIYISDEINNRVQEWAPGATSGITVAGSSAGATGSTAGLLNYTFGVYVDASGNIYVSDVGNDRIQRWAPGATSGTTVAGITGVSGTLETELASPNDPFVDGAGNLYICDNGNQREQKWAPGAATGTTAGGTTGVMGSGAADLIYPTGTWVDGIGNLYIADNGNFRVEQYTPGASSGIMVAGNGTDGSGANQIAYPTGVFLDRNGNIYVGDYNNSRVQEFLDTIINTFTPLTTSTYSVTVTAFNGCSVTETLSVGTATVAPVTTGTTTICAGGTTAVSDATAGGSWSSGNTSIATVNTAGMVTGIAAGTVAVTYSVSTDCGPASAYTVITVNPLPLAGTISGTTAVCAGATITLADAGSIGTGTWSSSTLSVATVSTSGIVHGISSGNSNISYTVANSCGSVYTYSVITVDPLPLAGTFSGSTTICVGVTATLTDAGSSDIGTWTSSNTAIATVNSSGAVTAISAGSTDISYAVTNNCGTAYAYSVVTVRPQPDAGTITGTLIICAGNTTSFSDAGGVGAGSWSSGSTGIATVSGGGLVGGVSSGTAAISYTTINSCGTAYAYSVITVNAVPVVGPVTGSVTLCAGDVSDLADTSAGGIWTSSNTGVATINTSGSVTAISSGTANISYTVTNYCGIFSTYTVVTVNPLPLAGTISGTTILCVGTNTSLTDAGSVGTGTWSSSNTGIATVNTGGVVTGIDAGIIDISYTSTNSCGAVAAFSTVTVNPSLSAGVITGTTTLCAGTVTDLNNSTAGGVWSSSNTGVATVNSSGVVTGIAGGTTNVSYTISSVCGTIATYSVITVNALPVINITPLVASVCIGSSATLTATGGISYSWAPSTGLLVTTGASIVASPFATTTYTVTVSNGNCSNTDTKLLTVNPLPLPITGSATVCGAATTTLSDGTHFGTWSISPLSVATISNSGVVTGVSSGSATVTYTLGTGCYVTDTIGVNAQPAALITPIGDTMLCAGNFVALTANTGAGLTYQWYDPAIAIDSTGPVYIASVASTYYVQVTDVYGCSRLSAGVTVSVSALMAMITNTGSTTTTCAGTPLILDANTGAGFSYQWLINGMAITGAVSDSYAADSTGDYSVVVSNSAGCSATADSISILVNPAPAGILTVSGSLAFCDGGSVLLTADSGSGYAYQWFLSGSAVPGATGISYTASATGDYWVEETNAYNCTGTSAEAAVTVSSLPDTTITYTEATAFCSGGSITLNAFAAAGATYQWYNDGIAIPGATNEAYTDTGSGRFTVMVNAGGCANTTGVGVTVLSVPLAEVAPLTPLSFCWGGGVTLSVNIISSTGGITYQWSFDGVAIPGATAATYNTSTPGDYSCQVFGSSCLAASLPVTVTEFPLPNPAIAFAGGLLQTDSYYTTYQWYKNSVAIPGANNFSLLPDGDGNYAVTVTDSNGCQSVSDVYVLSALAVVNVNKTDIKIYPNPAQTMLHITSPIMVRADITTIDGRTLLSVPQAQKIDISNLADGIYVIMLYNDNGDLVKTDKFIKTYH